jgi:uncharacterized membrane protein
LTEPGPEKSAEEPAELGSSAKENLELLAKFDDRDQAKVSGIQLVIERISGFFGSPAYFVFCLLFITSWIIINLLGLHAGWRHVDAPPFPWLQGMVSSNALLVTVAVLIRQNRMAQLAEHRSHLDLQINLLTEQKVTKIVQIVDQLQREFTQLRGKPDRQTLQQVEEMTKPADAHAILHAIKQKKGDV